MRTWFGILLLCPLLGCSKPADPVVRTVDLSKHPWARWDAGTTVLYEVDHADYRGQQPIRRWSRRTRVVTDMEIEYETRDVPPEPGAPPYFVHHRRFSDDSVRFADNCLKHGEETLIISGETFPCEILEVRYLDSEGRQESMKEWISPAFPEALRSIRTLDGTPYRESTIAEIVRNEKLVIGEKTIVCTRFRRRVEGDWNDDDTVWWSDEVPGGVVKTRGTRKSSRTGLLVDIGESRVIEFSGKLRVP